MNVSGSTNLVSALRHGASRRRLLQGIKTASVGGVLGLLGLRATDARAAMALNSNPDEVLLIPGPNFELELAAKGAGCDVRSWVRGRVGDEEAPLFLNLGTVGDNRTIINGSGGNVGIGTTNPTAKLHVSGDLRVEGQIAFAGDLAVAGEMLGATRVVSQHPLDPDLEIAHAALSGGEAGAYARGSGTVRGGEAVIRLPEHFHLVARAEGLTVQLTARGQRLDLFVVDLTRELLVVHEAAGLDGEFDFLVQGVRADAGNYNPIRTKIAPQLLSVSSH